MSELRIFDETRPAAPILIHTDPAAIAQELAHINVRFEQWEASRPLPPEADQEAVLAAYREDVERLSRTYGFQSVDVVSLRPDHPDKDELRAKFLREHTHEDFEVRFFVEGQGMFYLHAAGRVYAMLCTQGDLISVPAGVPHWFDHGERPNFKCIRFFTTPQGWVAHTTESGIDRAFPTLDAMV